MTVNEAVRRRRSIRAFLPTPVSEATLREVLDAARWAPSGSNIQAWKIVAVAGAERDAVVRMALEAMVTPSMTSNDDFPIYPPNLWEPLRTRRFALAEDMYRALGIPTNMFTVMFAIGRLPGWIAHWKEMRDDTTSRINRPRQVYTGATKRAFVPMSAR